MCGVISFGVVRAVLCDIYTEGAWFQQRRRSTSTMAFLSMLEWGILGVKYKRHACCTIVLLLWCTCTSQVMHTQITTPLRRTNASFAHRSMCVSAAPLPPTHRPTIFSSHLSSTRTRFVFPFVQAQGGGDMKSPSMSPAQPRGPGAPGQGAAAGRNDPAGVRDEVSHHVDLFIYICSSKMARMIPGSTAFWAT